MLLYLHDLLERFPKLLLMQNLPQDRDEISKRHMLLSQWRISYKRPGLRPIPVDQYLFSNKFHSESAGDTEHFAWAVFSANA